jgi:cysteinyl-tRNA synthetase
MKLYNTLSRSIEEVVPISGRSLGLYACGLTVYDYTHLGHLRKYSLDDVLVRTLRHAGFTVKFVQNVTDVGHLTSDGDTGEDKLEKGARKYHKSVWDIAHEFEDYFWRSMEAMGNLKPDVSCRATEHIAEQLEMVKTLEKKGFAYVIEGDGVYFDTSRLSDYGKLANVDMSQLQVGLSVEPVAGKRHPADFALWKFEARSENRAMSWPSPWAERSFPGWHIECSAMAMKYLGDQFEIHTGGVDHINIHHTNEIAQAEAATGKQPFVKYWVHHNFLRIDGEKMSKSLGNFFTIDDVINKGFSPLALRLLLLTTHYRSEMNFTWESLAGMQKTYDRLVRQLSNLAQEQHRDTLSEEKLAQLDEYRARFFTLMESDLNTPEALTVLWELLKSNVPSRDKFELVLEMDEVLGLGLRQAVAEPVKSSTLELDQLPPEIQALVAERQEAKQLKEWERADRARQALAQAGYRLVDGPSGAVTVERA